MEDVSTNIRGRGRGARTRGVPRGAGSVRTRGGVPRGAGRVRTRGGRASRVGRSSLGTGAARPSAAEITSSIISDLEVVAQIEMPLSPCRKRVAYSRSPIDPRYVECGTSSPGGRLLNGTPTAPRRARPSAAHATLPDMDEIECAPSSPEVRLRAAPTARRESSLLPDIAIVECGTRSPTRGASRPRPGDKRAPAAKRVLIPASLPSSEAHRLMRDEQIAQFLNYGSEEDSDDEEDESFGPIMIPRTERIWMEEDAEEEQAVDALVDMKWPPPLLQVLAPIPEVPAPIPEEPAPLPLVIDVSELPGPSGKFEFNWRAIQAPQVDPKLRREKFSQINCGPTVEYGTPYEAFTAIWSPDIISHIVAETNRYAQQHTASMIADGSLCPNSRITKWRDTDADELLVFFATTLAMGVVVKTRMEEYWNKSGNTFSTPGFSACLSINRFLLLGKCLHFCNNQDVDPTSTRAQAKIFKIRSIVDFLNKKFSTLYNLSQNIALDESLTQWKGWLEINQFIKDKAASIGIKTYEICESATGYLWRFEIHAGHEQPTEAGVSGVVPALVLRLLEGLENKGYTVYMDNFYNSPALARELKTRGFDCVGTFRTNRQFVPTEISQLTKQNMTLGQVCGCTSGDVDLVVWKDKNRVALMSTYHGLATVNCRGTLKPSIIPDYNICMGGVDRKDQMLSMYPIERRRNHVWYKKFFRRLLNASILNAYIMQKASQPTQTHRRFRTTLVGELLAHHKPPAPVARPASLGHYVAAYEHGGGGRGRRVERIRRVCAQCKKRTTTYCQLCNVPLCNFSCFGPYHDHHFRQ